MTAQAKTTTKTTTNTTIAPKTATPLQQAPMARAGSKPLSLATLLVLALTGFASASPATAADWRNEIVDSREAEQEARIRAGRRSGELTWLEMQRLRQEQRRIARMQREALADDGLIDRAEFRAINRAQNASARHIREERTDAQRPWWSKFRIY